MKIYVASKFEDKERVRDAMFSLKEAGHTITKDWTTSTGFILKEAFEDLNGVRDCDIFIGFFDNPDIKYKGAIAELGMAIALGKSCYIIGNELDDMIFILLPIIQQAKNIHEVIMHIDLIQNTIASIMDLP